MPRTVARRSSSDALAWRSAAASESSAAWFSRHSFASLCADAVSRRESSSSFQRRRFWAERSLFSSASARESSSEQPSSHATGEKVNGEGDGLADANRRSGLSFGVTGVAGDSTTTRMRPRMSSSISSGTLAVGAAPSKPVSGGAVIATPCEADAMSRPRIVRDKRKNRLRDGRKNPQRRGRLTHEPGAHGPTPRGGSLDIYI
mmetsp:Transcript_242/g.879  ORF Transcript_242/g.879 Transcript_242/m.879 type:complete len:203 (-) Transcript_242:33-641(-)